MSFYFAAKIEKQFLGQVIKKELKGKTFFINVCFSHTKRPIFVRRFLVTKT